MGLEIKFTDDPFNKRQKIVLILIIVAVISCLLFPPWLEVWGRGYMSRSAGYSFIFLPPSESGNGITLDFARLIIQLIIISIVGFVLYYWASKEIKEDT